MLKHNLQSEIRAALKRGLVIPASPLALDARRQWDERRQLALWRYYAAAGAGGIAVGVHTTQFAIRNPKIGLFRLLLALAAEEFGRLDKLGTGGGGWGTGGGDDRANDINETGPRDHPLTPSPPHPVILSSRPSSPAPRPPLVRIAGICGQTEQAVGEATVARDLGFHAGLLSLGAMREADEAALVAHCRAVAEVIPLMGFYLQPAVGGRVLPYGFWRRFLEIENVVAIKIAPFNRYQTLDVVRAVAESGRDDVALYTGNDDNIVIDLLTPYCFPVGGRLVRRRIVGGLLGHWAVWTRRAVELLESCQLSVVSCQNDSRRPTTDSRQLTTDNPELPTDNRQLLQLAVEVTDANAALFDVAHGFAGCIAGIHEVLRRQGLLEGIWCLDPNEGLSPGQGEEIDRVCRMYPHLSDDQFVAEHRDQWLR